MGLLTITKKVYLAAGHHRQPRNASSTVQVGDPEVYTDTSHALRTADSQIFYGPTGAQSAAYFLFWSFTDGSYGQTQTDPTLNQPVGAAGMTATAWYFPEGGIPGVGTAIIDDAFSAKLGNFIDDTFVTVVGDPALTSDANVIGVVSTAKAEVLKANASVPSTGEPFKKWMSFNAGTVEATHADTLDVPANASGLAFAVYEQDPVQQPSLPSDSHIAIYGRPTYGVLVDGGGVVWVNGHPVPVDPWGPLLGAVLRNSFVSAASREVSAKAGAQIRKLAASEVLDSIKATLPAVERAAGGKAVE